MDPWEEIQKITDNPEDAGDIPISEDEQAVIDIILGKDK